MSNDWPNGQIRGKEECSGCGRYKRIDEEAIVEPHKVDGEECPGSLRACVVNW